MYSYTIWMVKKEKGQLWPELSDMMPDFYSFQYLSLKNIITFVSLFNRRSQRLYNSHFIVFVVSICLLLTWPHPFFSSLSSSAPCLQHIERCWRQPQRNLLSNLLIPLIISQSLFYPVLFPPQRPPPHMQTGTNAWRLHVCTKETI